MALNTLYQPIIADHNDEACVINNNNIKYENNLGLDISHIDNDNTDIDGHENLDDGFRNSGTSSNDPYDSDFEQLVESFMYDSDYVGINQTACNIAYTIINASLVSLPFTAYNAGIPLFITLMVLISSVSSYIVIMVVQMANEKRVRTLEDLAEVCGGPRFFLGVCVFQIIFSFSMMCIALLVWADTTSDFFSDQNVNTYILSSRNGQVLLGSVLVLPMCLFTKSMLSLKWSAIIIVFSLLFCVVTVFITYYSDTSHSFGTDMAVINKPKSLWWLSSSFLIFYYSYNQRAFMVYRCLKRRNTARWRPAVHKANIGVTVLYIFFGTIGYLSLYRSDTDINNFNYFLINNGENKIAYDIVKVILSLSFLLTIPVDCLIAQSTFRKLYRRYFKSVVLLSARKSNLLEVNNSRQDEETLVFNNEIHDNNSGAVIDTEDGWRAFSTEVQNPSLYDNKDSSNIMYMHPQNNQCVTGSCMNVDDVNTISKNNLSDQMVSLRNPSKDELDQIIQANNAERKRKLIVCEEGAESVSRLDSSWASVMSRDATAAGLRKSGIRISAYREASNPNISRNNANALRNITSNKFAALALWILCLVTCILVKRWMYIAASIGTVCSAVLLFIFPTMLYFRMSVPEDFQASPIIFGMVPNRLYMTLIQLLGIFCIAFNIFAIFFLFLQGSHIIQDNS